MMDKSVRPPSDSPSDINHLTIPGGWIETPIRLAGREFRITIPADPDEVLNQIDEASADQRQSEPYWARLWPTSVTMAEHILETTWTPAARVLEIGCGIGLVGLAALAAGMPVTFSDIVPAAVDLAVHNAKKNGFDSASGIVFDWTAPPRDTFPLILGSDVLYDATQHELLIDMIDCLLDVGGSCWIGDPGRYHCEAFITLARKRDFRVTLFNDQRQLIDRPVPGEYLLLTLEKKARDNVHPNV